MPSPHSLYDLKVILIVSAFFYVNMNCFELVDVVSSWLRVGLVIGQFWVGGCGWFRVVADGFRWFWMVSVSLMF